MARKQRRHVKRRRSRHPLYMCMVKVAMCYFKGKNGATSKQIRHKIAKIYGHRGIDFQHHHERVTKALKRLVHTKCLKQLDKNHYKLIRKCRRYIMNQFTLVIQKQHFFYSI